MRRQLLTGGLLCLCVSVFATADDKHHHAPATTNAGFEKLKGLVGTWVAADENGDPTEQVVSVVKLTAGGSAIHDTLFPGGEMEMISIYTPDGDDVTMTHYCMLGNQPRMKADAKAAGNTFNFEFDGGTNLDPAKDAHMHAAKLTIVDANHLEVEGIGWVDGKPSAEMCNGMKLVRKE
ncbi:MAG: hypothetical protein JNG89_14575 [Planctomycetaceae bacterium]|nr:hypothetical protein [Planctomycetaceae bacterium]